MAQLQAFRPTIWSDQLIVDTEKAFVFRNVSNTSFEGEARAGNVVKINELGDISVADYTDTGTLTYQTLSDAQKELRIDQQKSFSFRVDDIARAQANVEFMQGAMEKAAFAIADTVDQFIAGLYTDAGVSTSNMGTPGSSLTLYGASGGNEGMLGFITNAHRYLDEANAPSQGRWMVVPAFMHAYLKYAGLIDNLEGGMKVQAGGMGNGFVGSVLNFDFYASNNVSNNGTQFRVPFGTRDAIGFVGQVENIETIRLEDYFADGVRGLYVYGAKVVRPDHLGVGYVAAGGLTS